MRLGGVLAERWDLLEADFQRFYGLELEREFDRAGCRRLHALLDGLPPEAATWRDDPPTWRRHDELFALVIDEIGRHLQVTAQLAGVKDGRLPKRTDIRPRKQAELTTDRAAIRRFFARR